MRQTDFIPLVELVRRTGYSKKVFYNAHCSGHGPLSEILTKLGGRLGCWRSDYDLWLARQRKLPDAA